SAGSFGASYCAKPGPRSDRALILRRACLRHGAVKAHSIRRRVGINELDCTLHDLVGADWRPVKQIVPIFDAEPRAVRAGGVEMETAIGQQARERARQRTIKDNGSGATWETEEIVGWGVG